MRLSPVELAERNASYGAVRHAIGRRFREEYDTLQPLPRDLARLVQRLEREEQRPPKSAPVVDVAEEHSHLAKLVTEATEKCRRMASLLSQLSANRAALTEAIAEACETRERSKLMRQTRRNATDFSWA